MEREIVIKILQKVSIFVFTSIFVMLSLNLIVVNADTNYLLDADGNPVEYNKSYYMEPYLFNGRGLAYETWLGENFVLLQHESSLSPSGQTIRFDHYAGIDSSSNVKIGDWTIIRADNPPVNGLDMFGYNPTYSGVQLGTVAMVPGLPKDTQVWIPTHPYDEFNLAKENNYFNFENMYNKKYLSYKNTNAKLWLDSKGHYLEEETLWRLIAK